MDGWMDGMMTEQLALRVITGTTGLKTQTKDHHGDPEHAFLSRISRK
jgi:hypothetical protein